MQFQNKLFIGGEFAEAREGRTIEVLNPHDNSNLTDIAEARAADVDLAVEAATRAYPSWRDMAAADRGRLLLKLADAIEANAEELARIESLDTGHPIRDSRSLDVPRTAATFATSAAWPTNSRAASFLSNKASSTTYYMSRSAWSDR